MHTFHHAAQFSTFIDVIKNKQHHSDDDKMALPVIRRYGQPRK